MGSISSTLDSILSKNAAHVAVQAAATQAQSVKGTSSGGGFGAATNVTLSPAAQAALNASSASSGSGSAAAGGGGGPQAPVTASASSSATDTLLVEEEKEKIATQVGQTGASEVVDSKGDVNYALLDQLLEQQSATQSA